MKKHDVTYTNSLNHSFDLCKLHHGILSCMCQTSYLTHLMATCVRNKQRLPASCGWQRRPHLITARSDEVTVFLTDLSS